MNDKFLSMYFNNEQIELIQKASLEKAIVNNILPPDEHYPKELVNFFEEWEQNGEKIEGNKLVIDDTDKCLYYKGYDPSNARGCIRQEAEAYINRILYANTSPSGCCKRKVRFHNIGTSRDRQGC